MKARRLFDADATDGYLLDGKYWIDPLITGVKTNADRIRAMTDDELAHLIGESVTCENCLAHSDVCEIEYDNPADVPSCEQIWLDWLKREVENDE